MNDISFPLAFLAGALSFLSPCVLPMIPAYVSLVSGLSLEELQHKRNITGGLGGIIAFVLGFSAIFMAMGASSSFLGIFFLQYQEYIRVVGGVLVIIFGLFIAGFISPDFLMREWRFDYSKGPAGYIGSFFMGMGFAAGWTPCIGPILGSILVYAGSGASASYGTALLAAYSLGLAVPFVMSALAINLFLKHVANLRRFTRALMIISGLVLMAFGMLLLTDNFGRLSELFPELDIML
jgi:cytochrome c-type biogenesis protein